MESSAALPHAARELLLKGGGCAVNFECAPELCAPLRAELARSGRSVGFVRADEGFYDRMDTAAYLRLFERMAGTRGMADAALAAMGLTAATPDPEGGLYGRTADGQLSGYMEERAFTAAGAAVPPPAAELLVGSLLRGQEIYLQNGITTAQDGMTGQKELALLRLLAVNFAIVTFICCFWFLGIAGTVIYTVVLFFLLRRRANRIQQDYAALLAAARRMAGGDLATPVEGDMGLFDPLKDELNQVRAGFEKAVAAEVRSQNMKTELITNVSHDLKTPLTAIITYVDLLKDPALSAEDRAKYIETLDKKSQRLKRLIEDLFEVSKAATRNVAMHYAEVDLAALLKQVQYELADKAEASGIDFRWQLPEERMPLVLDGQKTCRIFENLVVNITKYGMPGTRAYITLMPQEHGAQVVFKNISATELDFSAEEITDRFVRGDRSRNTEGSGLGLAIAKSFAELQGGTFSITVDGDLFKATVTLPDTNQPEQPETLPLPAAPDADAQSAPQTGGALPAGI